MALCESSDVALSMNCVPSLGLREDTVGIVQWESGKVYGALRRKDFLKLYPLLPKTDNNDDSLHQRKSFYRIIKPSQIVSLMTKYGVTHCKSVSIF